MNRRPLRTAGVEGRFTTGSTMRHVAVMTLTGSLGLTFMFLVDFLGLFYVALLGDETLTSAVGYAWTIQFFSVAIGIGFSIANTAQVSRALGARDREGARRVAGSGLALAAGALAVTAVGMIAFRRDLLALLGAEGRALETAAMFLAITLPSLPLMAIGMSSGAILRAEGDAKRAMLVTFGGGLSAMVLAPALIFGLGLGVAGAAIAMGLSRVLMAFIGLGFVIRVHDLAARPTLRGTLGDLRPLLSVAGPAALTQLSTPFGNALLTGAMARFGDSAVAGWSVTSRMTVLAFGGIFALSGAIGGIIGQNYGAGRMDRVRRAYRDAMIFCAGYVAITWAILALSAPWIAREFNLSAEGAEVVLIFGRYASGAFIFVGALFVANSAFNNLGRPLWSTVFNWSRDAAATPVMLALMTGPLLAPGVVYAQAAAGVIAGAAAALFGWRFVQRRQPPATAPAAVAPETDPPGASEWGSAPVAPTGRSAAATPTGRASGTLRDAPPGRAGARR